MCAARRTVAFMKRPILLFSFVLSLSSCLSPTTEGNLVPATVDDDPSLPRVALNGSLFHAEAFGDPTAPLVVMLHAGPGSDYRNLLRLRRPVDGVRLEDHHQVVFWDQRGAGLSRRHDPSEISQAIYDADLMALIDHWAPGRQVVLIGHSSGGIFATSFIAHHPERVAGAALIEPAPLAPAFFDEVKDRIYDVDFGSEWLNDTAWGQSIVTPDGHARLDYIRMLGNLGNGQPGYHESTTDRAPTWRLGAVVNQTMMREAIANGWDFTVGLEKYTKPVLFEGSELNELSGAEFQKRQARVYPNAKVAVIPGVGHDLQWVAPEATLRPIVAYLTEIGF